MKQDKEKFRFNHATGEVHVLNEENGDYYFAGKLNGRTENKFIKDYEEKEEEDE